MFRSLRSQLADNPSQLYGGIGITDLDGDGHLECFVASWGGKNLVLKWGGDAYFDIADEVLSDYGSEGMGVAAGDFDGDGREEIFVSTSEASEDCLFAWRRGRWQNLLHTFDQRPIASQSVLTLDRFGMGRFGFLVAQEGGPFRLIEMMGGERIADNAATLGLARIAGGRSLIAGPILGSGLDLYAGNEGIVNMLFRARTDGRYEEIALPLGLGDSSGFARGLGLLDANGDGRLELFCANRQGPHRLFFQGSSGSFADGGLGWESNARAVVIADFDNDGYEEIFIHNQEQANLLLAWREGSWRAVDCGEAVEPQGFGVAAIAADLDGDGRLELLLGHGESAPQPLSLYACPENRNHWCRVMPLTASGAPARGALVWLWADGRQQTRVIDCGSGYLSQTEPVAHFGLGRADLVERVEIRWVDGVTIELIDVVVDRLHRVPYPNGELH
ncbi:CRTAC1 family protein [Bryobacter aggregatus]|uniref:CRTAC1 family protein n=1 Tax=Bryobacter aggregatus TaxID=360054 RepID=UPI0004E23226|nr:CRTAC1 family protein [Bryobacter aggregatus]